MAIIFFADVKADPTLKGDVQKKISDAFGIVVELQQSNIPVLDYKVDVPSNQTDPEDFSMQIYYTPEPTEDEVDSYLEMKILLDQLLKGPVNPHGIIMDFTVTSSCDAPDPEQGFQRGDAPFVAA